MVSWICWCIPITLTDFLCYQILSIKMNTCHTNSCQCINIANLEEPGFWSEGMHNNNNHLPLARLVSLQLYIVGEHSSTTSIQPDLIGWDSVAGQFWKNTWNSSGSVLKTGNKKKSWVYSFFFNFTPPLPREFVLGLTHLTNHSVIVSVHAW